MSDVIANQIQEAMGFTLSAINQTFSPNGTRLFLLKRSGETIKFTVITELTSGFWAKWSEYRGQMRFRYAGTADVNDEFATATHLGYGVAVDGQLEVYEIDPESRDFSPPDGASPFRSYYAVKVRNERFTIPTP